MRKVAALLVSPLLLTLSTAAPAQTLELVGTRAQGMGGAFVAVADDASAVYWNPGGLARGAYFSLLLDRNSGEATEPGLAADSRSSWMLALATPALGLSYYRLERSVASAAEGPLLSADVRDELDALGLEPSPPIRLESLVTHHLGVTLVQSLTDSIAVGTTLKLVRGTAGTAGVAGLVPEQAIEEFDVLGRGSSRFDLDLGVMASGALGSVGLVVRNATEPDFETAGDIELGLDRQIRVGASLFLLQDWRVAADLDLTRTQSVFGDIREFATGVEGQVTRRVLARAGLRFNTAGDEGRNPALSAGASYAVRASFYVDGQVTGGADQAFGGWGIAGRLIF